jgi:CRISPR-associated protein Csy1
MKNLTLSEKIVEFIEEKAATKIGDLEKKKEKTESSNETPDASIQDKIAKKKEQFKVANWLSDAARRAGQLQGATHVLKFSHTSAEGSSVNDSQKKPTTEEIAPDSFISTASFLTIDTDYVGNAAALDVLKLLALRDGDKSLLDLIKAGDLSALAPFAENETQLEGWRKGFMALLESALPASHTFSKQIYFPIGNGAYHLISPLHASSLAHKIHKRINDSRYSEDAKAARKAKRESKHSFFKVVDYPGIAIQTYGGTKPQNVSQLNSERKGKAFLLSCASPIWEKQTAPPLKVKTIFSQRNFEKRVRK